MIKIIIVDDHKIFRDTLKRSLESISDFQIISEAEDGLQVLERLANLSPDIIIMDISMKNMNGLESAEQIISRYPEIKILILSMLFDESFIKQALKIGVSGYLLKEDSFDELISAINAIKKGKKYFSPSISDIIANLYLKSKPEIKDTIFNILSKREMEVFQLYIEGKTIKESADILRISERAIEKVRQNIKIKLKLNTLEECKEYAKSQKIIDSFVINH
jgi:DNA-binding NarL/FixJ family response regulator